MAAPASASRTLGARLLLPLLATVTLVMSLWAMWSLRQRERTLGDEARRETQAYAVALGIALESAFRDPEMAGVHDIIDRITREPSIYAVVVYGEQGEMRLFSATPQGITPAPADSLRRLFQERRVILMERSIQSQRVFSVIRPIHDSEDRLAGAFEVAQPLSFVAQEKLRTRQRFLLNTLTLLATLTFLILWLVRRLVARPLERFVAAARALGRGELSYRIEADPGAQELAELAGEFNRMAGHLQAARGELVQEAEERIALERRLRESEKLAAVGNLAAGLAHEIGAPLHVIRGRAEMLLQRVEYEEPHRRNLNIIVQQIGRITLIVRNLLDFARRREPHFEPVDAVAVAKGAAELLEPEMEKAGVTLEWEGAERAVTIGDANLLHQVFVNLFVNAIQALDGNGAARRITCTATAPADGGAIVEVRDSGPGIPQDALPRVFEPFFTTKTGGRGTGLGLAVARSIVKEHGGELTAANVAGSVAGETGAVFRVILTAAVPEPRHA